MLAGSQRRAGRVLVGGALLSAVLGSLHAFSILIAPLEQRFDLPRGDVSLTYSFALVAVTLAMLLGGSVYDRVSRGWAALAAGSMGALGLLIAASATALWQLWLGYSVLFGFANGLGYGLALNTAGRCLPGREGLAMGLVTAAYAAGAAITPFAAAPWVSAEGTTVLLQGMACAVFLAGLAAAGAFARPSVGRTSTRRESTRRDPAERRAIGLLWICYGTAVTAGLMAIGHAAEIARRAGGEGPDLAAPTVLALANMVGSVAGGVTVDRRGIVLPLVGYPLLSAAGLLAMASLPHAAFLPGLGLVGLAYGATIAAYPAASLRLFGAEAAARAYGLIFTAWGVAGFTAPWLAGVLFDATGGYRLPLIVAGAVALGSAACVLGGRALLARAPGP